MCIKEKGNSNKYIGLLNPRLKKTEKFINRLFYSYSG